MKLDQQTVKALYAYAARRNWKLAPDMPWHLGYHSEGPGEPSRLFVRYYWETPMDPRPEDSYVSIGAVIDEWTKSKLTGKKRNVWKG